MGRSRICAGHKTCKVGAPHRSSAACSTPTNRNVPNAIINSASMSQPRIQITMTMQADLTRSARGKCDSRRCNDRSGNRPCRPAARPNRGLDQPDLTATWPLHRGDDGQYKDQARSRSEPFVSDEGGRYP
jgi:hypothetical protein